MNKHWKAILAFLSLLATNAAADWTTHGEPWPTTWAEGARWLVSQVVGTWMVWAKANTRDEPAATWSGPQFTDAPSTGRHARAEGQHGWPQ